MPNVFSEDSKGNIGGLPIKEVEKEVEAFFFSVPENFVKSSYQHCMKVSGSGYAILGVVFQGWLFARKGVWVDGLMCIVLLTDYGYVESLQEKVKQLH